MAATQTFFSILRFNHSKEYDEVIQEQSEEEEKKSAARAAETLFAESFGSGKLFPGTEKRGCGLGSSPNRCSIK